MKKARYRAGNFLIRYQHGAYALLYLAVYLLWFCYLEKTVIRDFTVIHMAVDDYIPFLEVFVIPYFLWFPYVAAAILFLLLRNKSDYCRAFLFLAAGMTVFLLVSTLWPNGQHLRPFVMPRNNLFTQLVSALYRRDTPTNLWPSIHVYNSIGVHAALMKSKELETKKGIRLASFLLCVSIILATVLIKQHSMFDVLTAFGMAVVMYVIVYQPMALRLPLRSREKPKPRLP
ncbi:MAG: serine/threonine protein phosphatase [Clostridium sp.]|jgi:membrane-associated phospholipid phosphatase|nr:serine/threonine protein phosphatase [Clostridium sp.]